MHRNFKVILSSFLIITLPSTVAIATDKAIVTNTPTYTTDAAIATNTPAHAHTTTNTNHGANYVKPADLKQLKQELILHFTDDLKKYPDDTASVSENTNLLLLVISFLSVVGGVGLGYMGWYAHQLNKNYLASQKEIKGQIKHSVELGVAKHIHTNAEEFSQLTKDRITQIELMWYQGLQLLESVIQSSQQPETTPLDAQTKEELRIVLLNLYSAEEKLVDDSLLRLKIFSKDKTIIISQEIFAPLYEHLVENGPALKANLLLRARLDDILNSKLIV